jgi:hypothetical protein
MLLPNVPKSTREIVLPNRQNDRMLKLLPKLVKSIAETFELIRVLPNTESVEPKRMNDRIETEDPIWTKSITEQADPIRTKERTETLEPKNTESKTLKLLPSQL